MHLGTMKSEMDRTALDSIKSVYTNYKKEKARFKGALKTITTLRQPEIACLLSKEEWKPKVKKSK